MIYNELEHSLRPHPGYVLKRIYDNKVFRYVIYLGEVFEKCGKKLDEPYMLLVSDFKEIKDPLSYGD